MVARPVKKPIQPEEPPLDPAVVRLVDALARALAKEDHERDAAAHALRAIRKQRPAKPHNAANVFLQKNFPSELYPTVGVYVIGFGNCVKIGVSGNVPQRISELQQSAPVSIQIYAVFPGTRALEKFLHRRFKKLRTRGEWFKLEGDLKSWIQTGCRCGKDWPQ